MGKKEKTVDLYIEKAEPFAKPILKHIRKLVHQACPDVLEKMKWSFPHFDYKGMMCSMASFKQHVSFGFWKAALMKDYETKMKQAGETAMGHFGRITSLKDLPSDKILTFYIKEAVRLNEEGKKIPSKKKTTISKELVIPPYFQAALIKDKKARNTFENFPYSHKKEYLEWIAEAKTEETRMKRLSTMITWLVEGKERHWKYKRK